MATFIYTWHERRYNAIKVGSSADPPTRMLNFGLAMHLTPRPASLRSVKLAHGTNAKQVMVAVHNKARELGLHSVAGINELYGLRDHTYDTISTAILRAALVAETQLMEADNDNIGGNLVGGHRQ